MEANNRKKTTRIILYSVWILAIVNFLASPVIINRIKSRQLAQDPSSELLKNVTTEGKSYIDGLDDNPINGVNNKKLWGWAFLTTDKLISPDDYEREVILISDASHYTLSAERVSRAGVQAHFSDLEMNLVGSGFQAVFGENILLPGTYKIGILFTDINGEKWLLFTDKLIEKTNNTINLR